MHWTNIFQTIKCLSATSVPQYCVMAKMHRLLRSGGLSFLCFFLEMWKCRRGWEKPEKCSICYFHTLQVPLVSGQLLHRQNNPPSKKKLTAKAAAMEDISMLLHCPTEVQRNHNGAVTALCCTITWMQSCRTQMWDGKLLSPTYQRFYFQEKDLTAFWNLVRWTMQGAHEQFLTASLRGRKGGIWESLSLGNASWVFDITK